MRFYFDFSCPYAYLAAQRIRDLAPDEAVIELHPVLLGGLFAALGKQPMDSFSPAKARHNLRDMHRWAARHGVPFRMPSSHPMRTVTALRMLLAAPSDRWWALVDALYAAYWVEGRDITDTDVLHSIATSLELDADALLEATRDPAVKAELRQRTDDALEAGVFGVPTMIVGEGDSRGLWWGQDRLEHAAVAAGWLDSVDETPWPASGVADGRTVDVWFDFSSPFAYLAAMSVADLCARYGAQVRWQPFLLGGLFREIGTPDVPLFELSPAKQAFAREDMARFAVLRDVKLGFPSRFPMRTILPLRAVCVAQRDHPEAVGEFIRAVFRAYWGDDRDISAPEVVAACADDVGLDGEALVASTSDPTIKSQLIAQGARAREAGVFGAPTFQVDGGAAIWGQDRLTLLAAVLNGVVDDRAIESALPS